MSHFRGVAAVLATTLTGALLALIFWNPIRTPSVVGISRADLPAAAAGYAAGDDQEVSAATRTALPGATILARDYAGPDGNVDFTLVGATSRDGVHDPRLCLTGAGWRLSDEHSERLPGTPVAMQVCQAATTDGPPDTLVAYFYVVNGRVISSPTEIRAALLWSALLGRQSAPTYFVRFLLPLGADSDSARRQHAQMQTFAAAMWQTLGPKLLNAPRATTAPTPSAA